MFNKYLYLVVISLMGLFLLGLATYPYGVGVTPDSVNYLSAAKNFSQGKGLYTNVIRWNSRYDAIPLAFWPPFYPLAISGFYYLGFNLLSSAWIFNLCLLAFNVFLIGNYLFRTTGSKLMGCLGSLLFLFAYPTYLTHSTAWSEPLYIVSLLISFELFIHYLKYHNLLLLFLAGVMTGLNWLTRYTGITLALTLIIVLLFEKERSWKQRLLFTMFFTTTTVIPITLWLYRNYKRFGSIMLKAEPMISKTSAGLQNVWLLLHTISGWFFPYLPSVLAVILFFATLAIIYFPLIIKYNNVDKKKDEYLWLWTLFSAIYATFLIITCFFFRVPLVNRYLFVLLPPMLISTLLAVNARKEWWRTKVSLKLVTAMISIVAFLLITKAAIWGTRTFHEGVDGFTSKRWQESEVVNWLNKQRFERVLFSQGHDAVTILTKFRARDLLLARRIDQLERFVDTIKHFNGLVVYLDGITRPHFISEKELMATGRFVLVFTFADGRIYELKME